MNLSWNNSSLAPFAFLLLYLNTPRLATDAAQQVLWRWDGKAFGDSAPSGSITVNLRDAGQYYDSETGLHYNWNRYYDPKLGRYVTSDPIGLMGGLNTYSYVTNNPLRYIDPFGLDIFTLHAGFNVPLVGGLEFGVLFNDGKYELNGLPDIGGFLTIKKNYGGLALAKATVGVSATISCRENFDGTDAELAFGLGDVGGNVGGLSKPNGIESLSLDIGPQIGFEAQLTHTFSLTVGDAARFFSSFFNSNGGGIIGGECGCKTR